MKKLFATAIIAGTVFTASAGHLSLADRMLLQGSARRAGVHSAIPARTAAMAPSVEDGRVLAFIVIAPGAGTEDLEKAGVTVSRVKGDIAMVTLAASDCERVAALPCVKQFEISRIRSTHLDRARASAGVDKVHAGLQLDQPYTGNGVVAGIVDGGLDPNHINFRNADGSSRIGYLGHVVRDANAPDGWTGTEYDSEHIHMFTTDDNTTFHGTHTLGILAGSYRGTVSAAIPAGTQLAPVSTVDNPYYGVATGADIAAVCGDLYDRLIAEGIDRILDYAYMKQEPCVISLSLGSNTGVHSSRSVMSQFLELAAKEAVIVVSAGNEGDIPLSIVKTLSESDTECKAFLLPTYRDDVRAGQVYMYSDRPFTMQAVIFNRSRGRISYRMPVSEYQSAGEPQYYCSSSYQEADNDIVAPEFANAFEGYVGVGWDTDSGSGMYMSLMDYYTINSERLNSTGNYVLGFVVSGEPGQRIECFCDGNYTVLDDYGIAGWDTGSTDMTISDMACANDILVVGSYNTGDTYGALDGYVYGFKNQFIDGKISPFSSYGTLTDGRSLPHVCAPGAVIVSSCSRYYVENSDNGVGLEALCARINEDDRINYWCPAMGTSMSTPYVAGSIALWLEANPSLTIADVREIVQSTAVRDTEVLAGNPVQWGAGKFDAYAGLKEAIRRNYVISADVDDSSSLMIATADNRIFNIFLGGATHIDATVYSTDGTLVLRASASGDELTLDTSALCAGIYILNANGSGSRRILVK